MNNSLIAELRKNLNHLIETGALDEKYIVLFGMNTPGDEVIHYLAGRGRKVNAVIDNNKLNQGKKLVGTGVYRPEEILGRYVENAAVLICSRHFSEMKKQLTDMGYDGEKQVFKVLEMNSSSRYTTDFKVFQEEADKLQEAGELYRRLRGKYGENMEILVAPVRANGDVYIISAMMREYIALHADRNVKLAVIGTACGRIAGMFGLAQEEVMQITQEEMELLVRISRFLGEEKSGIRIVQPYYMYTGIFCRLEGYKGLHFVDFFRYGYFEETKEPGKILDRYRGTLREEENKYGIVRGNTFILAPYANSLPQIEWAMWEKIAKMLGEKGYKVFTNSASQEEPVIPGTEKIFFPIEDTVRVLNYAGGFMAMRNGLCEVASSSLCRQIILYPDKAAGYGKVKDVYGIKAAGLNRNVHEIEDGENLLEEIGEIL